MMDPKFPGGRALRIALAVSAPLALANCAGIGTPGREAAEKTAQMALVQEHIEPALRLARAARAAGDLASAANLYRTVIAAGAADPILTVEFADTLLDAGSFDEAIGIYSRIEANSPARLSALLGLTRAYLALSQLAKALESSEQARALSPTDARVLVARGVALDMLGRHPEAQGSYLAVLADSPRDVAARNNLALSFALSGRFPEALDILTPIARSTNASPRVRQNLALIYGLMGDRGRAADTSRADLDKTVTEANLRFFDFVRGENR